MISHDRHFLNAVCTHIADIDYETIITYTGGYDDMVVAKTQIRSRIEAENAQREKKIAQLNDFIARFSAGTRASQVTSRRKEVERLQTTELARSNIQRPYIKFAMERPSGRTALEFKGVSKAHGGLPIVTELQRHREPRREDRARRPQRPRQDDAAEGAARRRAGRHRRPRRTSTAATVRWGHEVSVGYFAQDHTGAIQKGMTAVEWLHQFDPDASRQDIHGLLGQMLFSGEEGYKPTDALSGGETARLLFCRIMLQKPNVLVLDEPTNHLDLESINALNVALQRVRGHGAARHARPGPDGRGRHARLALRRPPGARLQGRLRGVRATLASDSAISLAAGRGSGLILACGRLCLLSSAARRSAIPARDSPTRSRAALLDLAACSGMRQAAAGARRRRRRSA